MLIKAGYNTIIQTKKGRPILTFYCGHCGNIFRNMSQDLQQPCALDPMQVDWQQVASDFASRLNREDSTLFRKPSGYEKVRRQLCHCEPTSMTDQHQDIGHYNWWVQTTRQAGGSDQVLSKLREIPLDVLDRPEVRAPLNALELASLYLFIHQKDEQALQQEQFQDVQRKFEEEIRQTRIDDIQACFTEAEDRAGAAARSQYSIADLRAASLTAAEARMASAFRKGAVRTDQAAETLRITASHLRCLIHLDHVAPSFHRTTTSPDRGSYTAPMFTQENISSIEKLLEERQDLRDLAQEPLAQTDLSVPGIKARGWTDTMIRNLLGEPDYTVTNPRHSNSNPMKIYSAARVHAEEQTEAFAVASSRSARRKESNKKNRSKRKQTVLDWARDVPMHIVAPDDTLPYLHRWAIWNWEQDHPATQRDNDVRVPETQKEMNTITVHYLMQSQVSCKGKPPPYIPNQGMQHLDLMLRIRALQAIGSRWGELQNHCNRLAALANRQLPQTLKLHTLKLNSLQQQQDNDTGEDEGAGAPLWVLPPPSENLKRSNEQENV